MIYICNGISESMKRDPNMKQIPYSLSEEEFVNLIHNTEWKSAIGHESLARCLTKIAGKKIPYQRIGLNLNYDDMVLVVSLNGRLPEHPSYVEYKGRLNYSLLRFEKQSMSDLMKTKEIIEDMIKIEEM